MVAQTNTKQHEQTGSRTSEVLSALEWRLAGPHRGGRVVAVAGHPTDTNVFYFGHCAGGVWKTTDAGRFWENISDGYFNTGAVGAMAISSSDPNVLYVGMGETTIRGDVSHGDGVYKSVDGGKTWQHMGLTQTRHIAKVRIHPENPDLVYVAALGHAYGPNPDRGIYRSTDGGKTWDKILYRGERAGGIDLALDPSNPRVMFAAMWEAQRSPYSLSSGGPGSGLFKSTDGGDTWAELGPERGLPGGILGKIGVVISPPKPERVWALVEAKQDAGLYRSDDAGETWQRISDDRDIHQRAWYFMHIFADPQDPETVWSLNVRAWKSPDGGRHFQPVPTPFEDQHDLWIDPNNPMRFIEGNDGGACVSFNGGVTWSSQYNQPTAQFYHVATDNQVPYRIYGAQQDINTLSVPSRSDNAAITAADWYTIGGGESGYVAVKPDDPNIVYAGSFGGHLTRFDYRTRQIKDIAVWPNDPMGWGAKDLKYRFQWTFPIVVSTHDPNVVYVTSQYVHRSTNEGMSWETVSPDLTRNEPTTLEMSGGPITKDNVSTEYYATIFAFAESPVKQGVLWAGSDDGLVHVSQDGGTSWQNVTPPDLPEWAMISIIDASPHDPAASYVAATRYKSDDFAPYLYKTSDYGKTWQQITDGIPGDDFTRVIREDPVRRGLLFAGTETGVYASFDDGGHWERIRSNLPVTAMHDLAIKDNDLIAATHGRSFWILDDISPLRQWNTNGSGHGARLFEPASTIRFRTFRGFSLPAAEGNNSRLIGPIHITYRPVRLSSGGTREVLLDAGQNPPNGVIVDYQLSSEPQGDIELAFLDADGQVIKTFTSGVGDSERDQRLAKTPGFHRFVWDTRYPDATPVHGATFWEGGSEGPFAVPGRYQVRLSVDGQTQTAPFEIRIDPRVSSTPRDLAAQFDLAMKIRDKLSETHEAINQIDRIRKQLESWQELAEGRKELASAVEEARSLDGKLTSVEQQLMERSRDLPYHSPIRLNAKLAALAVMVGGSDSAPTKQSFEVFDELAKQVDTNVGRLRELVQTELSAFNRQLRELNAPVIFAE